MAIKRISEEDKAEIRRLKNAGFSAEEIAKMYGVGNNRIYSIVSGKEPKPSNPKVTIEKINELREQGMTYKQIAQTLNSTEPYIKKVVYRNAHPDKFPKAEVQNVKMLTPLRDTLAAFPALKQENQGRATATVDHVMRCMDIGRTVDSENIDSLYNGLKAYVELCYASDFPMTVANLCLCLGVARKTVIAWKDGLAHREDPEFKRFAENAFNIIQSGIEATMATGLLNPVLGIWWEKSHFDMKEADKADTIRDDPLGQSKTAEQIAAEYSDLELPD